MSQQKITIHHTKSKYIWTLYGCQMLVRHVDSCADLHHTIFFTACVYSVYVFEEERERVHMTSFLLSDPLSDWSLRADHD